MYLNFYEILKDELITIFIIKHHKKVHLEKIIAFKKY